VLVRTGWHAITVQGATCRLVHPSALRSVWGWVRSAGVHQARRTLGRCSSRDAQSVLFCQPLEQQCTILWHCHSLWDWRLSGGSQAASRNLAGLTFLRLWSGAGVCDDDIAACYCKGKFGRIPAPEGSPPGTPPIRAGRPAILEACMPMYGEQLVWPRRLLVTP
jgi:hypothetical protein